MAASRRNWFFIIALVGASALMLTVALSSRLVNAGVWHASGAGAGDAASREGGGLSQLLSSAGLAGLSGSILDALGVQGPPGGPASDEAAAEAEPGAAGGAAPGGGAAAAAAAAASSSSSLNAEDVTLEDIEERKFILGERFTERRRGGNGGEAGDAEEEEEEGEEGEDEGEGEGAAAAGGGGAPDGLGYGAAARVGGPARPVAALGGPGDGGAGGFDDSSSGGGAPPLGGGGAAAAAGSAKRVKRVGARRRGGGAGRGGGGGGAAGGARREPGGGGGSLPPDYPLVAYGPLHPQIGADLGPWANDPAQQPQQPSGGAAAGDGGVVGGLFSALLGGGGRGAGAGASGGGGGGGGGDDGLPPPPPPLRYDGRGVRMEELSALIARDMERPVTQRRLVIVYIIGGRMLMDWDNWGSNRQWGAKLSDFAAQLASVLRAPNVSVPDCVFVAQLASVPFARKAPKGAAPPGAAGDEARRRLVAAADAAGPTGPPVFSMAKSDAFWDVLYPNPYFGTWERWERSASGMLRLAGETAWASKAPVAFWRGSCVNWPGSRPRVDLVMKHHAPGLDVAFIRPCPVGHWPALLPDRPSDKLLKRTIAKLPRSRIVSRSEFARYRFLFHMPGSTQGSYSRNMQIALGVGSVVLKWDNPFYEFFYRTLAPWVHYVPVNASNAVAVVARLTGDDALAQRIAVATTAWYRDNLRGRHIRDYWVQLLSAYARLQRFVPARPANPCSCEKAVDRGPMRRCKVC